MVKLLSRFKRNKYKKIVFIDRRYSKEDQLYVGIDTRRLMTPSSKIDSSGLGLQLYPPFVMRLDHDYCLKGVG